MSTNIQWQSFKLTESDRAKIKDQLINNEKTNLESIEVQTGNKVIEENIQRFEDIYGRN